MEQREVGTEYQRWMSKLLGYDFEIHYKPGPSNKVADALSRVDSSRVECNHLLSSHLVPWEQIQVVIKEDEALQQLTQAIAEESLSPKEYEVLKYKGRLVIPSHSPLTQSILQMYHN